MNQAFGHSRNGRKLGTRAQSPFWGGGLGPHLTQSPGLKHCSVRRIKMKLGSQVGLGHGYIVLDGDPDPLP